MKDDLLYIDHLLDCIEKIENYSVSGRDTFFSQSMHQDAILRNFEIMGEATKRVSPALKDKNPHIPWKEMAGLRDVLIHDYSGINLDIVWNIIQGKLPQLKSSLERLKESE